MTNNQLQAATEILHAIYQNEEEFLSDTVIFSQWKDSQPIVQFLEEQDFIERDITRPNGYFLSSNTYDLIESGELNSFIWAAAKQDYWEFIEKCEAEDEFEEEQEERLFYSQIPSEEEEKRQEKEVKRRENFTLKKSVFGILFAFAIVRTLLYLYNDKDFIPSPSSPKFSLPENSTIIIQKTKNGIDTLIIK